MDKKIILDEIAEILQEIRSTETIEEAIKEDIKDSYYKLSDGIYGLENLPQDPQTKKIQKDLKKLLNQLETHLNKKYKGWD